MSLPKNQITIALSSGMIALVPIWLLPTIPILLKVGVSILFCLVGYNIFFSEEYLGKKMRRWLGTETEEERREREREEKEKKATRIND